jgi:peptidoglycan hydrolase-like protein with peptidoglycan-binding domain
MRIKQLRVAPPIARSLPRFTTLRLLNRHHPGGVLGTIQLATGGTMRSLLLAGGALLALAGAPMARAQTAPPLSYVQPLTPDSVSSVQERLRAAGAYTGNVDGVWGPDSAAALQRYQQSRQLQVTGQMNEATAAMLGLDPGRLVAGAAPAAPPPPPDQLRPASVRALQARLGTLGFYRGAVDGVWGQSTQNAIETFQRGRGLQPNGQLNPATVTALGLAPDALAYR